MDVLDELTTFEPHLTKLHVEARLADWERRIDDLYDRMLDWLPSGWTGAADDAILFDEEMMRKHDVPARHLPVLRLSEGARGARVEPRGLWIIGANGRLDLISSAAHYLIVDRADIFEAPHWQVASLANRRFERALSQDVMAEMLA